MPCQHRPRSHKSSQGLRPLEFVAAGNKLGQFPLTQPSDASLNLHNARRNEGWNAFDALLKAIPSLVQKDDERTAEEEHSELVVIEDLCQRVELSRMMEQASEHLQGNFQVFLPRAADRLNGAKQNHRHVPISLALSGRALGAPLGAKPGRCDIAWPSDDIENTNVVPVDSEQRAMGQTTGAKRSRSKSGQSGRGTPTNGNRQSNTKRLTYIGQGLGLPSMGVNDGPLDDLAGKFGKADCAKASASVEASKKKVSASQPKRTLVGCNDGEVKAAISNVTNREEETHLLSPDSLGFWATQAPTLAAEMSAEGAKISQGDQNSLQVATTFGQAVSSASVAKGRPALRWAQSTPTLVAEGSLDFLEICHRVGGGGVEGMPEGAQPTEAIPVLECNTTGAPKRILIGVMDAKEAMLESVASTPTLASTRPGTSVPSVTCTPSSAIGSRPATTGSSRLEAGRSSRSAVQRRGMPLGASAGSVSGCGTQGDSNMFGLVMSRSRTLSQGSPTDLGPALQASSQAHIGRSKPATTVRSSSSAGRLCTGSAAHVPGARSCPAVALSANSGGFMNGSGLSQ